MVSLAWSHIEFIHGYVELLQSIEEGLEYVEASFADYSKTEGDLVLSDVLDGMIQVQSAHVQLEAIFAEDVRFIEMIEQYRQVIDECLQLEGKMEWLDEKRRIVTTVIMPAFIAWNQSMLLALKPYITH